MVGAYMNDPLWIAEYTVYLEQNFCVGHNDHHCIQMVRGSTDSRPHLTILRSRCISPPCTPWPWRSSSSLRTFATSTSLPVVAPSPPCKQLFIFRRSIYVLKLKDRYLQKKQFLMSIRLSGIQSKGTAGMYLYFKPMMVVSTIVDSLFI